MQGSLAQLTVQDIVVGVISASVLTVLGFVVTRLRRRILDGARAFMNRRRVARFGTRMLSEGISNFYVGREDWLRYRRPPSLGDYLRQATKSVQIVCYWMAQGTLEGIPRVCAGLAEQGVAVEIVMIDPDSTVADTLQFDLEIRPDVIRQHVRAGLERLQQLRETLSAAGRERFLIKVSPTLPQAAVIVLDGGTPHGKAQMEFRPYREPRANSFSLELSAKKSARLYAVVERSLQSYFADASIATPVASTVLEARSIPEEA